MGSGQGLRNTPGGRALEEQEALQDPRAEIRRFYGDPDAEAAVFYGPVPVRPQRGAPAGTVGRSVGPTLHLTAAEVATLIDVLQGVLNRGRNWPWRDNRHRDRVRRILSKLRGDQL